MWDLLRETVIDEEGNEVVHARECYLCGLTPEDLKAICPGVWGTARSSLGVDKFNPDGKTTNLRCCCAFCNVFKNKRSIEQADEHAVILGKAAEQRIKERLPTP